MSGKLQFIVAALCGVLLCSGCVNKSITVNEVLQQKQGDKVYTACNLWYDEDNNIYGMNYMEGGKLPIGSVIEPEMGDLRFDTMKFKDEAGNEYTLKFSSGKIVTPPAKLIAQFFTLDNPAEQIKKCSPQVAQAIKAGKVIRGMTRDEVLLSWGRPSANFTPNLEQNTWIYNISRYEVVRVLFSGDKVTRLLSISPEN